MALYTKGQLPANTKHDGAITQRKCSTNNKVTYTYIRLANNKWRELHKVNWEKVNGPIPPNTILRCLSDDTNNCAPSNWYLITRAENLRLNRNTEKRIETLHTNKLLGVERMKKRDWLKQLPRRLQLLKERAEEIAIQIKAVEEAMADEELATRRWEAEKLNNKQATGKQHKPKGEQVSQQKPIPKKKAPAKPAAKAKQVTTKQQPVVKATKIPSNPVRSEIMQEKRKLPDKSRDYNNMKLLRIDAKTSIYIGKDEDPDEARHRYYKALSNGAQR